MNPSNGTGEAATGSMPNEALDRTWWNRSTIYARDMASSLAMPHVNVFHLRFGE